MAHKIEATLDKGVVTVTEKRNTTDLEHFSAKTVENDLRFRIYGARALGTTAAVGSLPPFSYAALGFLDTAFDARLATDIPSYIESVALQGNMYDVAGGIVDTNPLLYATALTVMGGLLLKSSRGLFRHARKDKVKLNAVRHVLPPKK